MRKKNSRQNSNAIQVGGSLEHIPGEQMEETRGRLLRQRSIRTLIHDRFCSHRDKEGSLSVTEGTRAADDIFDDGTDHIVDNFGRAVIFRPESNAGGKPACIRVGRPFVEQALIHNHEIEDNDLPSIAEPYLPILIETLGP
jgi:type I restriction enzyme M protein